MLLLDLNYPAHESIMRGRRILTNPDISAVNSLFRQLTDRCDCCQLVKKRQVASIDDDFT